MKKRLISGAQPTGLIHIGNYFGAIKQWVQLQDQYESLFMIVDLHALTVPNKETSLVEQTLQLAKLYLACGLDHEKVTLFVQSQVKEHAELAWVLSTLAYMGELQRMTQFKEKSEKGESANLGLFAYPVLMAADILLYQADIVPVGEDQKQHLELTRDLAQRFNGFYGETFKVPEPQIIADSAASRIRALDNPHKKMSKSGEAKNYISLLEDKESVEAKIAAAVTDSDNEIYYDLEKKPGVSNLLTIYALASDLSLEQATEHFEGAGYGELKKQTAEAVIKLLEPIQTKFTELDDGEVQEILQQGAEKASAIAGETMEKVKDKLGLNKTQDLRFRI